MSGAMVIRDKELSHLHSKAVDKNCPYRCGTGLCPIPGTQIKRAIELLAGGLTSGRDWYPLYQVVLVWCHQQESGARGSITTCYLTILLGKVRISGEILLG